MLLAVCGIFMMLFSMCMQMVTAGESTSMESSTAVLRSEMRSEAESATQRALWDFMKDREKHPDRILGEREGKTVWLADGLPHNVELEGGMTATVRLFDADTGLNVAGAEASQSIGTWLRPAAATSQETVDRALEEIADYLDPDDFLSGTGGMERDGYEQAGYPMLPRNGVPLFAAEIQWLPSVKAAFDACGIDAAEAIAGRPILRLVPPEGCASQQWGGDAGRARKPNLFSASPAFLRLMLADQPESGIQETLEGLRRYQEGEVPLASCLDANRLAMLRSRFSFRESGIVTVAVEVKASQGGFRLESAATYNLNLADLAGNTQNRPTLQCWDKVVN